MKKPVHMRGLFIMNTLSVINAEKKIVLDNANC